MPYFMHTAALEVIGFWGNTKLYCSSMDAIETVASPTFFCSFQGQLIAQLRFQVVNVLSVLLRDIRRSKGI